MKSPRNYSFRTQQNQGLYLTSEYFLIRCSVAFVFWITSFRDYPVLIFQPLKSVFLQFLKFSDSRNYRFGLQYLKSLQMKNSTTLQQKFGELIVQQQSVGISLQTFKQKFVFNQNSGPDAIFLDINSHSPSQIRGMTIQQQNCCTFLMAQMIFKAGQMLKLPISTTIVALNIAQYYYTRKSFLDYDFRDISMGATFLACKSEQTLRRSYQIASVFDWVFKMYQGIKTIRELQLNSPQYNYIKQKVTKTQNELLFQLGFEVSKLFDIPHRYISSLIASFSKHKLCNEIVQHSWTFLNDIYRTKASVFYPSQIISSASVFMALQKLSIPIPEKPWWILMESGLHQIKHICFLTHEMYQSTRKNQVNINKVSDILQNLGKRTFKVTNVLPVPYYRKITLQSQGLLMKTFEQPIKMGQNSSKQNKKQQKQEQNQIQQRSQQGYPNKERSKKQKKKHKKKRKENRNGDRSRSSSSSQQKVKVKGRFQNEQETPKINKNYLRDSNPEKNLINHYKTKQGVNIKSNEQEKPNENQFFSLQNQVQVSIKADELQQKIGQVNIKVISQNNFTKKSSLFDAKSMLSKISLKIKNIEVKNQNIATLNSKNDDQNKPGYKDEGQQEDKLVQKMGQKMELEKELEKEDQGQLIEKSSSSDQENQLMAELIKIKKKNQHKKEEPAQKTEPAP